MNDATHQLRRIDQAIDAELIPLAGRIDDGRLAIDQAARIACHLLEAGISVFADVPYIDTSESKPPSGPSSSPSPNGCGFRMKQRAKGASPPARPRLKPFAKASRHSNIVLIHKRPVQEALSPRERGWSPASPQRAAARRVVPARAWVVVPAESHRRAGAVVAARAWVVRRRGLPELGGLALPARPAVRAGTVHTRTGSDSVEWMQTTRPGALRLAGHVVALQDTLASMRRLACSIWPQLSIRRRPVRVTRLWAADPLPFVGAAPQFHPMNRAT
ncbi:hypothetical protein [Amycolatopsis acidiphila]|uniref:hypothetical protein n=1 Tax=Amycolatopsis acidiphila TaxID=715473 RepID=UPI0038994BFD